MVPSGPQPGGAGRFTDALARVRTRFIASFPERIDEIECQFERISDGEDVGDCLRGIERELHKLAGLCGSVGFADLGAECGRVEYLIVQHLAGEKVEGGSDAIIEAVFAILNELERIYKDNPA